MSATAGQASGPLLAAEAVSARFGQVLAVDDVTMSVAAGEVVGLLGANGAGKTTLIRMLLGLTRPSSGETSLFGGPPDRRRRRRLGYVPQGMGLYPDLTVAENVAFTAGIFGVPAPGLPAGLAEVSDRLVDSISLGLARRLAFVCALLHDPQALVLDEPTSGVDALARSQLWEVVGERAAAGVGVLVTTHYLQEAQQCDRLLLMSDGHLVAEGDESDIIGDATAVQVQCDDWAGAFAALADSGAPVALDGTAVRIPDGDAQKIITVLRAAGIEAQVQHVPATIAERMTMLAQAPQAAAAGGGVTAPKTERA